MREFNMKAQHLNRKRPGRTYVPSFTETVYFGGRTDIDRSSFVVATAAKDGQFYTDTHFVVGALASPHGSVRRLIRAVRRRAMAIWSATSAQLR